MTKSNGASPDGDRATHERSRVAPSPPSVGIPSADDLSRCHDDSSFIEALTPSAETKAAYIGEFSFTVMDRDDDGEEIPRRVLVPWDTTKEIMAAILTRAQVQP